MRTYSGEPVAVSRPASTVRAMNNLPDRSFTAWVAASVVASWPSAVAAILLKLTILGGHGSLRVLLGGVAISAAAGAFAGWLGWPSARNASALWGLYGLLAVVPVCSLWAVLGQLAVPTSQPADVFTTSFTSVLLALPVLIFIGPLVGGDVALVLRCIDRARQRYGSTAAWIVGSIVLATHYGAGLALAFAGKVWR